MFKYDINDKGAIRKTYYRIHHTFLSYSKFIIISIIRIEKENKWQFFWLPLYHIVSLWFPGFAILRFQGGTRSRLGFTSFFYIVSFKKTRPPVKPGGPLLYFANDIYVKYSAPGHFLLLFCFPGHAGGCLFQESEPVLLKWQGKNK